MGAFVEVNWIIMWFSIWLVSISVKIKLYVKEIYYSYTGLDCYSKTRIFENFARAFLLRFVCGTERFRKKPIPSFLYHLTDSLSTIFDNLFNK